MYTYALKFGVRVGLNSHENTKNINSIVDQAENYTEDP